MAITHPHHTDSRWSIEWTSSPGSGKSVILIDRETGRHWRGHDWADWDLALRNALEQAEANRSG